MKEVIRDFIKMLEEKQSKYDLEIAEIRDKYKKEIPSEDIVTPAIIKDLEREKKKFDKKWGEEGSLKVEKAYGEEDAYAYLSYKTGNLICSIHPIFRDGNTKITRHRKWSELTGSYSIHAQISHPYHEGDELWARASKDRTNWEILYRNDATGRSTVKYRTKNFCNLRTLEKTILKLEKDLDILSKGHTAIW